MKNHPVKFLIEGIAQGFGILSNPVNTDVNFSIQDILFFRQVKSDDIGIKIVWEMLLIDVQKVGIRTKNDVQLSDLFFVGMGCFLQKPL